MSNSKPDPAISTVGLEQEPEQLPLFTLTRPPGSSEVVLRTGDGVTLSLPLVSRGDFTLYEYEWWPYYDLRTVPPAISFLLSPDPPSSDKSLGATAHGSLSFDHGKAEESITVNYAKGHLGTEEVTMTWLHLFALLPGYHHVKLLLHHGADPKAVTSPLNRTPLHLAATLEIATVLIDNEAEVNVRDRWGQTPLYLATRLDHQPIVKLLLSNGADPNIPDKAERTPLLHASRRHGHQSIVELLLAHGADVLATDRRGRTPLSEAKTEELILVMIGLTEDLNRQDQQTGNTLLHSCCLHGSEEAAKRLIEKGARLDVKNSKGETALDIARAKGYAHIASHFPGHLQTGRFERDFEVVEDEKHKNGVLGKGAFGRVFKAKRRGTDDVFAIKEIPFPPEDAEKTLREVRIAMKLSMKYSYILTHHDAWLEDRRTSDEGTTSTQGVDGDGPAGDLPFPSGSRTVEIGRNNRRLDESSETSSPSQEESDDGIWFEETETGQNDPSQDKSSDQGESRQDNQRRLPRGNEEECDEPPTRSSAQGGGSEGVWTSGAEGGSSTAAEEYLKTCTFTLYIQMDLMEMTLEDYIRERNEGYLGKKSSALSEEDRRTAGKIFWDLCSAVDFVHKSEVIHRDLKPSNVLLSSRENPDDDEGRYSARLSDFGLSTRLEDEFGAGMYKTVGCGTVSYAAPEQLKGGPRSTSKGAKYGEGVDVYSLALIAVELWTPMSISERPRVFEGLRSPEVRIPKELEKPLDEDQLELVRRGLSHEPTERPTASNLKLFFN
ncbi:unnamed protein product [Cyprideis torosa]|uniref:non-specific serine/threonine protein kinase n=1 Tax=Cyprideis torosa TaxID=163714 RepID=A0A7R8ZUE9_9CRUS|nr:unnamed protein product [Cyprideis torosa]CAG0905805.1 unnamed protein product [Cyprideis torosa]